MKSLNYKIWLGTAFFFFLYPHSSSLRSDSQGALQKKKNAISSPYSFRNSKRKGYTVLEMVLYVGIFAIITLLTVNTVLALTRAVGEIRTIRHTIRDADIAMERMIREIRAAQTVDATASILNTHPGKLVLTGTSSTITFSLLGGEQLFLKKNTGSPASPTRLDPKIESERASQGGPASLTSSSTRITNLVFTHLIASSSEAVRVRMTMDNKNFYGTAVLRGSYK